MVSVKSFQTVFCVASALVFACVSFSCFAAALNEEQALDLLAAKTQFRLNEYFSTDRVAFVKSSDMGYDATFSYAAFYWRAQDMWRGDFFINAGNDLSLLSSGSVSNGFSVSFKDYPSRFFLSFYCVNPRRGAEYLVYGDVAKQENASFDGVADALTRACLDFQSEVAASSPEPSVLIVVPSYSGSSCVLRGDECCKGALCKRVTQNSCPVGQTQKVTGCDVTCTPRVVCGFAASSSAEPFVSVEAGASEVPQPSDTPAAVGAASVAASVSASVPANAANGVSQQSIDLNLLYWVLAGVAVVALVYWFVFRVKDGGDAKRKK